jgi:hypothetical protein
MAVEHGLKRILWSHITYNVKKARITTTSEKKIFALCLDYSREVVARMAAAVPAAKSRPKGKRRTRPDLRFNNGPFLRRVCVVSASFFPSSWQETTKLTRHLIFD